MGIHGLFQILKPVGVMEPIGKYKGKTAVVDIMTWLYKGVYSITADMSENKQSLAFLSFPLKMLMMLQTYEITPICVFDGNSLLAKKETNVKRAEAKKDARETASALVEIGEEEEAKKYFSRSLILRTNMINLLMDILKTIKIGFVVAPYEADA